MPSSSMVTGRVRALGGGMAYCGPTAGGISAASGGWSPNPVTPTGIDPGALPPTSA